MYVRWRHIQYGLYHHSILQIWLEDKRVLKDNNYKVSHKRDLRKSTLAQYAELEKRNIVILKVWYGLFDIYRSKIAYFGISLALHLRTYKLECTQSQNWLHGWLLICQTDAILGMYFMPNVAQCDTGVHN